MEVVYSVYGYESGWLKDFKYLKEAKQFLKDVKIFDFEQGIKDILHQKSLHFDKVVKIQDYLEVVPGKVIKIK